MAARPRKRENRHLPDFLYYDKDAGVYRFTLINGVRKSLVDNSTRKPLDRATSIAIAREYNNRMRPEAAVSVDFLIRSLAAFKGRHYHFRNMSIIL